MKKLLIILSFVIFCGFGNKLFQYPKGWPEPKYDFRSNKLTKEKIELGRHLFYDPILSKDNTISCENCHSPYSAFTHIDHKLSHGINDSIGDRNSLSLMNLAWAPNFMWDGAINHLDMQSLAPISHPAEMGSSINEVVKKLNQDEFYKSRFGEAFGKGDINSQKVLKALAQFMLTLVSSNSKYDRVKAGKDQFSDKEAKGYAIFKSNCGTCHQEPLFTNYSFENTGLGMDSSLMDAGRFKVTGIASDSFKFKVPTLRNIEFSFPYMHDGRFTTLNQVLRHYQNPIGNGKSISAELAGGIDLTDNEKVDLISFLLTLSDQKYIFNPRNIAPKKK